MRPLYVGAVVGLLGVLVVAGASSGFTAVYSDRAVNAQTVPDSQGYVAIVGEETSLDVSALSSAEVSALNRSDVGDVNANGETPARVVCEMTVTNDFGEELEVTVEHFGVIAISETLDPGESAGFLTVANEFLTVEATGDHVDFQAERRVKPGCDVVPWTDGGE